MARVRRPHQAPHHRAAARHDGARDVPRRGRGASLWLVLATLVGGTLSAGAANTFNSVYDRDIDRLMHRTSNRPMVTGEVTPRNALLFGAALTVVSTVWFALVVNVLSAVLSVVGHRALRRRLHRAAQAPHVAEHRLGRHRRVHADAHRLVGRDRHGGVARGRPVPRDLLLDAAALLAALMAFRDDYSAAGVPMLPGRAGAGRGRPPDRPLLLGHGRRLAPARARSRTWAGCMP